METIIGLGQAGCNIADCFAKHDEYDIYKIDTGLEAYKRTPYGDFPQDGVYNMMPQSGPEEYEKYCPNFKNFFKDIKGEILFIVGGSGDISGTALRILEYLKGHEINILYIRPDVELLPEMKRKQEWVTFNILQEYARSAVLKRIYIVENSLVEQHLGEVPLIGYHDRLNEMIVSTMHMINVYNHIDSVTNTFSEPYKTARISTIGIFDIENNESKEFFLLDRPREMRYYYTINKDKLKSDGALFKRIKQQVKDKISDDLKVSYGIFATNYKRDFAYTVSYSASVQKGIPLEEFFLLDK